MRWAQLVGRGVLILRSSARTIAKKWNRIPIHCSYCCRSVDGESVGLGRTTAWCQVCHQVFEAPMLKAPSWITGVLGIVLINLN